MKRQDGHTLPVAAVAIVATFWAGMLAGVSFHEVPGDFAFVACGAGGRKGDLLDFQPGRMVAGPSTRSGCGFSKGSRLALAGPVLVAAMVAVETLRLLPMLDGRVEAVIAKTPLASSPHHLLYVSAEGAKLLLLCAVALTSLYHLVCIPLPNGIRNLQDASHPSNRLRA